MNKKLLLALLGLALVAALIPFAKAQITVAIDVRDSNGNSIKGATVAPGTVVSVYGYYKDNNGELPATAKMEVRFIEDGTVTTLFVGTVNSNTEVVKYFTLTKIGTYEFRWDCTKQGSTTSVTFSTLCRIERGLAKANVFVVPEPATIAGLLMALSAFGLIAIKRNRK